MITKGFLLYTVENPSRSWKEGLGFNFYEPGGIEEAGHDDSRGGGADLGEDLAVRAGHLAPMLGTGQEHAGTDDVVQGGSGLGQGRADEVQAEPGLGVRAVRGRATAGRHGSGAGHQDPVAGDYGAGEPEYWLVRGVPADALTMHAGHCLTPFGYENLAVAYTCVIS